MLNLSDPLRLADAPAAWQALKAGLQAECAQVQAGAGAVVQLQLAGLKQFDSAALTVLLSAARLCAAHGVRLELLQAPAALQALARVYGVAELLWPVESTV